MRGQAVQMSNAGLEMLKKTLKKIQIQLAVRAEFEMILEDIINIDVMRQNRCGNFHHLVGKVKIIKKLCIFYDFLSCL